MSQEFWWAKIAKFFHEDSSRKLGGLPRDQSCGADIGDLLSARLIKFISVSHGTGRYWCIGHVE
jgi:hypothetical protein